jgi:hypothetical protein
MSTATATKTRKVETVPITEIIDTAPTKSFSLIEPSLTAATKDKKRLAKGKTTYEKQISAGESHEVAGRAAITAALKGLSDDDKKIAATTKAAGVNRFAKVSTVTKKIPATPKAKTTTKKVPTKKASRFRAFIAWLRANSKTILTVLAVVIVGPILGVIMTVVAVAIMRLFNTEIPPFNITLMPLYQIALMIVGVLIGMGFVWYRSTSERWKPAEQHEDEHGTTNSKHSASDS